MAIVLRGRRRMASRAARRPPRLRHAGVLMAELDRRALADFFSDYRSVSGSGGAS
jgi:hypothetical protein